jgi:hypothetical protein
MRKRLLPVLLLSALTACSKQVSQPAASETPQPAVSQESKHGYELAKTWNDRTGKAKIAEADEYYTSGSVIFGKTSLQLRQLNLDRLYYGLCVTEAHLETLCKGPADAKTSEAAAKACVDAGELGPQHIAQCDKLIDELPKLIEKQNAVLNEELKR